MSNDHTFDQHTADCKSLGDYAAWYAELGLRVLPLVRGGKKPHPVLGFEGGVTLASSEPEMVRGWWRAAPHANIGVATGGGLAVLDFDVKGGNDGLEQFTRMSFENMLEPVLYETVAATPNDGWHVWLRSFEVRPRVGIMPGVDVKSNGGYVVVPPSGLLMPRLESGGQRGVERIVPYTWHTGCPCDAPSAPGWLSQWAAYAPSTGTPERAAAEEAEGGISAPGTVEHYRRHGIPVGERNNTASRIAAGLFRRHGTDGHGFQMVSGIMHEIWEASDKNGFGWGEMAGVVDHARDFVARQEEKERRVAGMAVPLMQRINRRLKE
jgi:hypothetical protein